MIELQTAVKIYLAKNRIGRKLVEHIARWQEDKTLPQNASAIGMSLQNARRMAYQYGLPYKLLKQSGSRNEMQGKMFFILHNEGYTYTQIGEVYGITKQAVELAIHRSDYKERVNVTASNT